MPDLTRTLELLDEMDARLVAVGHGRDEQSVAAASWLRTARRLTACEPDAWVIADTREGWAQVERRLRETGSWDPMRTVMLR